MSKWAKRYTDGEVKDVSSLLYPKSLLILVGFFIGFKKCGKCINARSEKCIKMAQIRSKKCRNTIDIRSKICIITTTVRSKKCDEVNEIWIDHV